jgi:hypothetical protein
MIREAAIEEQKYYEGFNVGRERHMFKDEIQDVHNVYVNALNEIDEELESVQPVLLNYMKDFIKLHENREIFVEKLETLKCKLSSKEKDKCCT